MNEERLLKLILKWLMLNDQMREINKYLYESTELFEKKYEKDFNHELYDFFSSKITIYTRQENILLGLLNEKQIAKLQYLKLLER